MNETEKPEFDPSMNLEPQQMENLVSRALVSMMAAQNKRRNFFHSKKFADMVKAMNDANGHISNDGFYYYPFRARVESGWDDFDGGDIEMMFQVCGDPCSDFIDPGSIVEDPECPFVSRDYTVAGLRVSYMSGQGTMICIKGGNAE